MNDYSDPATYGEGEATQGVEGAEGPECSEGPEHSERSE